MQHSCERNRKKAYQNAYVPPYIDPNKDQQPVNGVMFREDITLMYDDGQGHCVKTFSDLFQCTGVPVGYTGGQYENFQQCKNWWPPKTGCRSCKLEYPNAEKFQVWVDQQTGHFFYKEVYYIDANGNLGPVDKNGNLHTFNTDTCKYKVKQTIQNGK